MNPELMRNLWLELSPRRMAIMAAVLGFIFVSVWLSKRETLEGVAFAGETLFYAIVILWGTRNAAQSVVGEIRDRTWDLQRLSAIAPWEMVWGKLFGATSYVWFGGALCLVPVLLHAASDSGPGSALTQLAYFVSMGLVAHGTSLLTSLMAARRRMAHSRLDVFLYQMAGLIAAGQVYAIWATAVPSALGLPGIVRDTFTSITWYGTQFEPAVFYLGSLAIFFGWILAGTHQFMRQELQVSMNPIVWIAFLIFLAAYAAGFADLRDRAPTELQVAASAGTTSTRLMIASGVLLFATYVSLFAMPKERVKTRWLLTQAVTGRLDAFFGNLPGWLSGFVLTTIATMALIWNLELGDLLDSEKLAAARHFIVAVLGELARNIGIVLFFNVLASQRRGDFAAGLTLALIYWVAPLFLAGAGNTPISVLSPWFAPEQAQLSSIAMWIEAAAVWMFAVQRLIGGRH